MASRRSARSSASRRTRPWLRVRRAEMPSTAQRPSALISRSSLCRAASSSSNTLSRHSSKPAKPRSSRRTSPRSTQSVRSVRCRRNARSWLTATKAVRVAARCASSQPIASMSRWLVGSSSSIRSGASARIFASAARRRSPPEACAGSSAGSSFSPSIAAATRHSSPGRQRLPGEGAERREAGEVRVLRHVADAERPGRTKRVPASGATSPAISFISVDLPEPLRPTSAIRSPGWTASADAREERVAAEARGRCRRG